jgi:hypothetical protein
MDDLSNEQLCELVTPILSQKQQSAYYNIPPPRLNIVSPYPIYTTEQLNMRRKVEILKYSGSQQNTKTNSFTKKQQFSNLVRNAGNNKKVSQYVVNQGSNLVCLSDKLKPTSTTACDVPGKPMILQYDPNVPLYNYGNYKNNRSYAVGNQPLDATYSAYTQNIVEIVSGNFYSLTADEIIASDTYANYTYTGTLGSFVIRNNFTENIYTFNISTPIAIWFNSSIQSLQGSVSKTVLPKTGVVSLNIHIKSIQVLVYYNDTIVNQVTVNNTNSSLFKDVVCNLETTTKLFYAIKYVGMLKINNLFLETPPQTVYTFKYVVNYSYNSETVDTYLDFIQTGVYANLQTVFQPDYLYNCVVNTTEPPVDFEPNTFTQYVT